MLNVPRSVQGPSTSGWGPHLTLGLLRTKLLRLERRGSIVFSAPHGVLVDWQWKFRLKLAAGNAQLRNLVRLLATGILRAAQALTQMASACGDRSIWITDDIE